MKSYFKQTPGHQNQDRHCNQVFVGVRRATRPEMVFTARIVAVLFMAVSLFCSVATLAQDSCQEVNELMNFDYRSWGIGVHRNCPDCEVYDIPCDAEWAYCKLMKEKQILAGKPVEAWILASRALAIDAGVSPIPYNVRDQLKYLYPMSILDKVRYKTGSGFLGSLQWFRSELEGKGAITLVDVIVFADPARANDAKLWAHELEHVRQYGQLGVDGFAQAYVDQTCILPGELGYDSGNCKLEQQASRKSEYYNKPNLVNCCIARNFPTTLDLRDRVLNTAENFIAREYITVGPNVVLQNGGNVTLRAGRVITMSPGFRSELGGKLSATIDPTLAQSCPHR